MFLIDFIRKHALYGEVYLRVHLFLVCAGLWLLQTAILLIGAGIFSYFLPDFGISLAGDGSFSCKSDRNVLQYLRKSTGTFAKFRKI
ncbi:MAG: hypothetical protein ACI4D3_02275 [Lachnospiraceae bacterium]